MEELSELEINSFETSPIFSGRVVGVVLIIFGMQASASLGSRLSELFTGTPSDRTIWLLILGVVAAIVGLGLLLVGRRRTT
jgi:LPXTG-motif cell wall-anchored protein